MRRKLFLATLLLLVGMGTAHATPQIPDILIYEGKEYPIQNDLLYDYFIRFPERNPKKEEERCSALWRGYRSIYEVSDGRIFLKNIVTGVCGRSEASELKKVVPTGERLVVDWYTGLLRAFYGRNDENPYSLESLNAWEHYSFFEVRKGAIQDVRHFDNKSYKEFMSRKFESFKRTQAYDDEIKRRSPKGSAEKAKVDSEIKSWHILSLSSLSDK